MNIFEITIQRKYKYKDNWPVVVEYTKKGELPIRCEGILKLNSEDNFAEIRSLSLQLKKYGEMMGKALFHEEVRDAFVEALAQLEGSQDNNDCLHLLLQVEAEDLRELRWERLCAPKNWNFLSLNQRTPFSFYIPTSIERRFPPIGLRNLRALVVVASPQGLDKYQLAHFDDRETVASVKQALGEISCDVLANVNDAVGLPTPDELMKRLTQQDKYYTLLHIVCHGKLLANGETALYLAGADNCVELLTGSTLIDRLKNLKHAPHFAFLSTCESASAEAEKALGGLGQRLVRELGMPAVVAMTEKVTIKTANALATTFYQKLRDHGNVDLALVEATAGLQGRDDITVPALFSRLGGRPLFSDVERDQLTDEEIKYGLETLQNFLPERAPVLRSNKKLQEHIETIRRVLGGESDAARKECKEALDEVNSISSEVLDLSFKSLALGKEPSNYDSRPPFQGLYPFKYENHEFFCGRKELINELQKKLGESKFLPILGASGSGKSSIVMAGLIPVLQLEEPQLVMAYMTPKVDPLAQLEASLSSVQNKPYILVVDQFEEIFTLCNEKNKRQAFIDKMLEISQNQQVILTMRADFWGECATHPKLRDLMEKQQKLIAPMNAAELRSAIDEQARKVGLRFEVDLVNKILDDLEGEPGAMPLLQHALLELWNRRHGRWLLSQEYRDFGGVKKAIANTADNFYKELEAEQQKLVRNIFIKLIRLDESTVEQGNRKDTRQRVESETLLSSNNDPNVIKNLLKCLADERLVITNSNDVTKKEEVEIAHEALIRHWQQLSNWLDENRESLLLQQRIKREASEWKKEGLKEDYLLLQGGRLDNSVELLENKELSPDLENYVKACKELCDRQDKEKEARNLTFVVNDLLKTDSAKALNMAQLAYELDRVNPRVLKTLITGYHSVIENQSAYIAELRHEKELINAMYSPDGEKILTCASDGIAKLWDKRGRLIDSLEIGVWINAKFSNYDSKILTFGEHHKKNDPMVMRV